MDPVTSLPHFDHFETERAGPVAVWRINRLGKANALTAAFWPQLRGLLDAAAAQPGVRAVVLTGSGDRSFSAGGESRRSPNSTASRRAATSLPTACGPSRRSRSAGCPSSRRSTDWPWAAAASSRWPATWCWPPSTPPSASRRPRSGRPRLRHPARPVGPRAVHGQAHGAGRRADQRPAGVRAGAGPAGPARGRARAAALRLGAKIAARAPLAVEVGKRMVNRGVDRGEACDGIEAVTMLYSTRDAAEGIRAFTERREPRFEGR